MTTEPAATARYEFDDAFQSKIAALALRDPTFCARTDGLIKPDYFENQAEATLVDLGQTYFEKYKRTPDTVVLLNLIKEKIAKKVIRDDMRGPVKEALGKLLKADIGDRDFVADRCADFARHQAIGKAIYAAVDHMETGDFDRIKKEMQLALDTGTNTDFGNYDYFEEIEGRTEIRKGLADGTLKPTGITSGIAALDDCLKQKGWGRKELSILMGAAKSGKTMGLASFAINAALAGNNVLVASLEVSREIYAERIDANIADIPMKHFESNVIEVRNRVRDKAKSSGLLKLHSFPTGTMRPSDLRRLINHYKARGIIFDLVVVDYADIMAPEFRSSEERDNSKNIYIDLRAIAVEENLAVLSATQTNREGAKAALAKMTDVAEDFNKIRTADIVISINMTEEERAMGEARLFFAASRNQEGGFCLRIKTEFEKARFITKVLGRE